MPTNKHVIQVQTKGFKKAEGQTKRLGGSLEGLAGKVGMVAGAYFMSKGLISAFQFATRVGKEFEQSMANLKAISGATGSEMLKLSANARQLGASTKFTASQVGELSVNYAKLGFSASEILKVSKATLDLASATGEDLATSSAVAGGTLRAFGLDAKQTGMVTDVMAKSFSTSALDLSKFSEAMKYVAPVSKQAGFSIQETTAILGQLANSSIDGSMAGTSLKKVISQMSISGSKLSQVFGKSVKGFDEFVAVLQETKKQGGLTDKQLALIPELLRATIPVLVESSDKMMAYKQSLDDAGGSAERMANIQMDTLEGRMLTLNSATEGLGISFFETFDDVLKGAVDGVISFVSALDSMIAVPMSENLEETRLEMLGLFGVLKDTNMSLDDQKYALNRINKEFGSYLPSLLTQESSLEEIGKAQLKVNDAMIGEIVLMSAKTDMIEITKKHTEAIKKRRLANLEMKATEELLRIEAGKRDMTLKELIKTLDDEVIALVIKAKSSADARRMTMLTNDQVVEGNRAIKKTLDLYRTQKGNLIGLERAFQEFRSELGLSTDVWNALREELGIPIIVDISGGDGEIDSTGFDAYLIAQENITLEQGKQKLHAEKIAGWNEQIKKDFPDLANKMGLMSKDSEKTADNMKQMAQWSSRTATSLLTSALMGDDIGEGLKRAVIQLMVMVVQAKIYKAIMNPKNLTPTGILGTVASFLLGHSGGRVTPTGIQRFHGGGGVGDNIPAILQEGEFVMRRDAVSRIGVDTLSNMNEGGGGGITLHISGNVMTEDFAIDQLIPAIDRARREGLA